MKRTIYILICMLIAVSAAGQSAKKYCKVGEEFYHVNKYEDALIQFSKAIDLDPEYDKAYIERGKTYDRLERYNEAAQDYEKALVFVGNDEEVFYLAGRAYFKAGQFAPALSKLNKAIDIKSNYVEAYQVRTQVFIEIERYDEALADCKKALRFKENEMNLYNLGQVYEKLDLLDEAEEAYRNSISKNKNVVETHNALATLLFNRNKFDASLASVNNMLRVNPRSREAYILRAKIYEKQFNLAKAVDDASLVINMYPSDPELYVLRGDLYKVLSRYSDAVIDYTNAKEAGDESAELYFKRAGAYEAMRDYKKAMQDYERLLEMSKYDGNAQRLLAEAEQRMFEINREDDKPVIELMDPVVAEGRVVHVPRGTEVLPVTGMIQDDSDIKSIVVNDFSVQPLIKDDGVEFLASLNLRDADQITIEVSDVYDNKETSVYSVVWTETQKPEVSIIAPYASDNNLIYLDTDDEIIYVEGKIEDESKIKAIYIDDVMASYVPTDLNPIFTARVNIKNRSYFTVKAEDAYGNRSEVNFNLNRESADYADNPMGKTWAIFIENSNYEYFASLEGPTKDVTLMQTALAKYQVHNFIRKKDMTKDEMARFFAIELRDMLRSNRVSSLLIWYAGHGKYVNETGYWIPVDAKRDDEFTYFNINSLKASMQTYPDIVAHTLVVTDACESGASFYQAMRDDPVIKSCDDWEATRFKSSQVYSSAGNELATDDSQFTRTFANTLINNPGSCIPIESIVIQVNSAVVNTGAQQKPKFGKISGLEDENGTFFFIPKNF